MKRLFIGGLLLASTAVLAASVGPQLIQPIAPPAPAGFQNWREEPLRAAIAEWRRLRGSETPPFSDFARFLLAHPGWPGETALRKVAERRIDPNDTPAAQVVAYFTRYAPLTTYGQARYAEALTNTGRRGEAKAAALAAWTGNGLNADDENRLITRFGADFGAIEHDQRMERLLWNRATTAAARQLPNVSSARRALFEVRLALQQGSADAISRANALGNPINGDPGYILDRLRWMTDNGQTTAARGWLAAPRTLNALPFDPAIWLDMLLINAKAAAKDGQLDQALAIGRLADTAYPAGLVIRDRPLDERDDYTTLVWIAGTTALDKLGRPAEAMPLFDRYARAAQTPQTQTKGWYWAGIAAVRAGQTEWATSYFAKAAQHVDQFYGQLSAERLGRDLKVPAEVPRAALSSADRAGYEASEIVRAIRLLGKSGEWTDQTAFIRQIAQSARTDTDHILAGELALSVGRPDLGVMVSRAARNSGTPDPVRIGFPEVTVPFAMQHHWTIIHAISRQESQFDREATSRTGARGLMQLMPGTAREQAGKLGLSFDASRLGDVDYNVMLGSSFFARMLAHYGGNYVLAVASYNAGPGNVNKFIRANGDPRLPGVDIVRWIEAIPFTETRGYVQRVLENAVVYDLLNPSRARAPVRNRLSAYLGKDYPG